MPLDILDRGPCPEFFIPLFIKRRLFFETRFFSQTKVWSVLLSSVLFVIISTLYICMSACSSVHLSTFLLVYKSTRQPACLSACLLVNMSTCLRAFYLSTWPPVYTCLSSLKEVEGSAANVDTVSQTRSTTTGETIIRLITKKGKFTFLVLSE